MSNQIYANKTRKFSDLEFSLPATIADLQATLLDAVDPFEPTEIIVLTPNSIGETQIAKLGLNITTLTATSVGGASAVYDLVYDQIGLVWDDQSGEYTLDEGTYIIDASISFIRDSGTGDRYETLHLLLNGVSVNSHTTVEISGSTSPVMLSINSMVAVSDGDVLGLGLSQIHPGGASLQTMNIGSVSFRLLKIS